tara:strand:+ start:363 stop:599 length:237 start_codon:yes stop_codon:yes gene_type:complete
MTIDKYTKFILTLIAVGILGINFHFFGESVVKKALAVEYHDHDSYDIYGLESKIRSVVENDCYVYGVYDYNGDAYISC